jgi:hypothetical protein
MCSLNLNSDYYQFGLYSRRYMCGMLVGKYHYVSVYWLWSRVSKMLRMRMYVIFVILNLEFRKIWLVYISWDYSRCM